MSLSCFAFRSAGQEAKELGESQPTAGEEGEEEGVVTAMAAMAAMAAFCFYELVS